ncbi:hypothetical protein IKG07_01760 [Candidatus Saccharibacteria bacterium]|nr:hypothetical protein [Candidatus Saccharibacteria bacterium]
MPTTKKKTTTKKCASKSCKCKSCKCKKTCKCKGISSKERAHVCFVAVLSITAGILLCADAAMMIVH